MEYFGVVGFIMACICLSDISKLKKKWKKKERQDRKTEINDKEKRKSMSKLIEELVGKYCLLVRAENLNLEGRILAADDEWIKIEVEQPGKKEKKQELCLVRIEEIEEVKKITD